MGEDGTTYATTARRRCLGALELAAGEHGERRVGNPREEFL